MEITSEKPKRIRLAPIPSEPGIYLITCQGKTYVGRSFNVRRRRNEHWSDLRLRRHRNYKLQRLFYKTNTIEFKVLQILKLDKTDKFKIDAVLEALEQTWMNIINPDLNLTAATGSPLGCTRTPEHIQKIVDNNSNEFKLYDPEGNIVEGKNLKKFCRENNFVDGCMFAVLNDKAAQYKGWTNSLENHLNYKKAYEMRCICKDRSNKTWRVSWSENKVRQYRCFVEIEDAKTFRDSLEEKGIKIRVVVTQPKLLQ